MPGRPDPGGIFASDTHRRVLGHLPLPDETATSSPALLKRLEADASTPLDASSADDLAEAMADLEADGHATRKGDNLRMTKAGLRALTGPIADEPPPAEGDDA